jgi:hypothetical protein
MNNDKDKDKVHKEKSSDDEINLKTVELRLTSVREAIQRSRYVFLVMTIASSAILFTLWNDRFSRDKDLAFTTPSYETTEIKEKAPAPLNVYGRQQLVAEWYKNRIIQIGLLGIRLSVSDLSIMGSFTLVVITIWFYYSQRRENQALVTLLRDVHENYRYKPGLPMRQMVYQGIKHSLVFIRTEVSDKPLKGLDTSDKSPEQEKEAEAPERETPEPKTFTDRVFRFLSFLPFWAIIAILIRDASALFMRSPTAGNNDPLGLILIREFKLGTLHPIFLIIVFDTFAIFCAIYTRMLCNRNLEFAEGSKNTLKEFKAKLDE